MSLPQAAVGIGDDAAILDWPVNASASNAAAAGEGLVLCTDTIVDGVDFLSGQHNLANVGR